MTENQPRERVRRAIRAVRREDRKAAALHAAAEATAATLAVNLALAVLDPALPGALGRPVALPAGTPDAVGAVRLPDTLGAGALVAVAAGAAAFLAGYLLRLRRPAVERFEAVNPPVAEALRTARDALRDDREGPMADRLYASVLARLETCSSLGLIAVRRLALALVLVGLLATATVQVAVVDLGLGPGGGAGTDASAGGPPPAGTDDEYGGLEDPDEVLGDPEDVSAGDDAVNATLPTQGEGGENESDRDADPYATGGFGSAPEVEGQQAGFAEQERLEDAELIREYNLRIREEEEE